MPLIFCNYLYLDIILVESSGEHIYDDRQRQINDQLMTISYLKRKKEEEKGKRSKIWKITSRTQIVVNKLIFKLLCS